MAKDKKYYRDKSGDLEKQVGRLEERLLQEVSRERRSILVALIYTAGALGLAWFAHLSVAEFAGRHTIVDVDAPPVSVDVNVFSVAVASVWASAMTVLNLILFGSKRTLNARVGELRRIVEKQNDNNPSSSGLTTEGQPPKEQ